MLRIIEGKTEKGRVLLEDSVTSWTKARPMALQFIAEKFVGHPVMIQFGEHECQVVTISESDAKKILASS